MITLRRGGERRCDRRARREIWHSFGAPGREDPFADGFGTLEGLDEARLPPSAGLPRRPGRDAEIVTYVHEGSLAYEDSTGCSGIIPAGEFQRTTSGRGVRHRAANASRTGWAHVYQVWLRPSQADLEPTHEQRRFSAAQRRGSRSLRVRQCRYSSKPRSCFGGWGRWGPWRSSPPVCRQSAVSYCWDR